MRYASRTDSGALNFGMGALMTIYALWLGLLMALVSDSAGEWMILVGLGLLAIIATGATFYIIAMSILGKRK